MTETFSLAKLSQATQLLSECRTVEEAKPYLDMAEAARHYAKVSGMGLEATNYATEIKLRAERRIGELRKSPEASKAGRPFKNNSVGGDTIVAPPTLAELGITAHQSSRFQAVASIPDEVFEAEIIEVKAKNMELTSAGMMRVAQEQKREAMRTEKHEAEPFSGKYRVWYADPPWSYGNSGVITDSDNYGRAARHYPSMSIAELCEMGTEIKSACEPDAVLFMWVTSPLLEECFEVIRAWGFKYKTSFVWDKVKHNFGHYNSVRHELLLICTRGSCTPDNKTLYDSVLSIEKSAKHSEKPEDFRRIIDALYTWGDRIELFARTSTSGWDSWGNEAKLSG